MNMPGKHMQISPWGVVLKNTEGKAEVYIFFMISSGES